MTPGDTTTPPSTGGAPPTLPRAAIADRAMRRILKSASTVPTPSASSLEPALFAAIWVALDGIAVTTAFLAAYWIRFTSAWIPAPLGVPPLATYVPVLAVVLPVSIWAYRRCGLYRPGRVSSFSRDSLSGVRAAALAVVVLVAAAFFYRSTSFSRGFVALFWVATTVAFPVFRRVASVVHGGLRKRGHGVARIAILGGGEVARRLEEEIRSGPGSGLIVAASLGGDDWRPPGVSPESSEDRALRTARVRNLVRSRRIHRILVTDAGLSFDSRMDLMEECHSLGISCGFVPDLFEVLVGRTHVEDIGGFPLVGFRMFPLDRWDRFQKRSLDIAGSLLGLVALLPLLAFVALCVRLDSPGPVFYRQQRLGRDGREFDIVKFRSMHPGVESDTGPVRARRTDGRPTRVGRVIRRLSLDELPQLWNVLRGVMSLVGPRPERPHFVSEYQRRIPRYLERHEVKSGMTGWAQVNGFRGDTSIEGRTRLDLWYLENWSLALDVKILVLTAVRFLFQKEAF
ncbi:MAG: exopolysaccharide biosynthesis polyprenyl glycosylphosphotransferase [Gemmatimonadota bacterium]|nr:exopolysaccharide biosynthesis polyprenyl glycosylphosphotransferase [Gemmatimonadota bacterium]MDP6802724.1 exopolysaccharide biosynthesis polyprenyl glycosylphosphotransferase [Gemmatimonadota bacterium]MDP7031755.1 exopolysaccharide biosynthesis polyprenyl glycosylphosphotransferase [Gemmatimonadota bacterium]